MGVPESIISFWVSALLACAPLRYRLRWLPPEHATHLGSPAMSSALGECVLGLGLFLVRFFKIAPHSGIPPLPLDLGRAGGFLTLVNTVFEPLNILFLFMFFEGMFRAFGALVGESVPMLPLAAAGWVHGQVEQGMKKRALPPLVPDRVEEPEGACDLMIASCRSKPHWHPYVSIRYRGTFYGLVRSREEGGPRPFVYELRKRRDDEAVVVVYAYDASEGSRPENVPVRWAPHGP